MNMKRLLPVLLAAMALPAYAQDDSGLWTMFEQLDWLDDGLLLRQDAQPQGAPDKEVTDQARLLAP